VTTYRSDAEAEAAGYEMASDLLVKHADLPFPEVVILHALVGNLGHWSAFATLPQAEAYARGIHRRLDQKRDDLLRETSAYLAQLDVQRRAGESRG
jgi:hypothetical protein